MIEIPILNKIKRFLENNFLFMLMNVENYILHILMDSI
jgi:hypothetical protein